MITRPITCISLGCLYIASLIALQAPLPALAQVPGKRRVVRKVLKKVNKLPKVDLNASPSKRSKAAIAAANAAIIAAGAKAALDTFYETNDREAFHKALGETRVSSPNLLGLLKAHIRENFYQDEYDPTISLTEKQHHAFTGTMPLREVYLTKSGSFLIGNLYYEVPDDYTSLDPVLAVMKPFTAKVAEKIVNNPEYAEYIRKLDEREKEDQRNSAGKAINDAFLDNLRRQGFKVGLSDEDKQKILSLSHSSSLDSIPPQKIAAYNYYPKLGLVRSVFEDPGMQSLSLIRIHLYGHRTDKYGEDHLIYCRSILVARNEIARIKNWKKIDFSNFVHYEQMN